MARYDVYELSGETGFILDVQADLLDGLNSRMVIPLLPVAVAPRPAKRLNPVYSINGQPHITVTQFMAAVPRSVLKKPIVNLSENSDEITNALDMLFQGY